MTSRTLTVRVARIELQAEGVLSFELAHPWGRTLPGYTAGAHIDVHTPGGFLRTYSLALAPPPGAVMRYVIGVKREAASRGGSAALHERVREGDLLAIGSPRNSFPLVPGARRHRLVAGGIGLTPLLAMAQQLARDGAAFELAVFARSAAHLAFAAEVRALGARLHFDDPAAPQKIGLKALLAARADGEHLYLCGPAGFMRAAREAAAAWPDEAVHVEYFAPPVAEGEASDEPFTLHLARSGVRVPVAADQSAVAALHDVGIEIPVSCEQGVCGTCVVPWLAGEPEHRDFCLSATERASKLALCCVRSRGAALTLDL
jgi:vanillate O-demethylase ferredoxin subunit